jgi:hypothetical protein
MILYARNTASAAHRDILLLDAVRKKESLITLLKNTSKVYNWHATIDLSSPVSDEGEIASGRKKFTRKIKENVLVKPFYSVLLKMFLHRMEAKLRKKLSTELNKHGKVTEVNLLTQSIVNHSLLELYPHATVNYFEHGLGDYLFIQDVKKRSFSFYCIFASSFREYLQKQRKENSYVKELPDINGFPELAHKVLSTDDQKEKIYSLLKVEGKKVVIFLDSMEVYHVPDNYWTDCLDLFLSMIPNPSEYTFILKPHHNQEARSIKISKDYILQKHKLKAVVIERDLPLHYGIEVLFSLWDDSTDYVFSIFSSGLYYISKIYERSGAKYYHAYDFFKNYTNNSPLQFIKTYEGLGPLIKNVFSQNCEDISGNWK